MAKQQPCMGRRLIGTRVRDCFDTYRRYALPGSNFCEICTGKPQVTAGWDDPRVRNAGYEPYPEEWLTDKELKDLGRERTKSISKEEALNGAYISLISDVLGWLRDSGAISQHTIMQLGAEGDISSFLRWKQGRKVG